MGNSKSSGLADRALAQNVLRFDVENHERDRDWNGGMLIVRANLLLLQAIQRSAALTVSERLKFLFFGENGRLGRFDLRTPDQETLLGW